MQVLSPAGAAMSSVPVVPAPPGRAPLRRPARIAVYAERPPPGPALSGFAQQQLRRAAEDLARPGEARHEGVHLARKRIRRARAALALAGDALPAGLAAVDLDLRRLCRGLSALRDAQALWEVLTRLRADPDAAVALEADDWDAAFAAAEARRARRLADALARDPDLNARRARLLRAAERIAAADWSALRDGDVRAGLARSLHRAKKAGRRARRDPQHDALWHVYRRRLRRLRQQATLLKEVAPHLRRALEDKIAPIEARATALGESQDDALLLGHCLRRSPFPPGPRAALRRLARARLQRIRADAAPGEAVR
jgi:hypothetical protein